MPELPEVETVRRGLAAAILGRTVVGVDVRRADLRFPLPEAFSQRLAGRTVDRLERRAKYLSMALSGGDTLVMHLGMTGRFTVHGGASASAPGAFVHPSGGDQRHDHVTLRFDDGASVVYNDPRRFGFMLLMADVERDRHALFRNLGVEPLGDEWSADYAARRARGRKTNLKTFLMDQRIVAGLGNIYASEALHRARISPNRSASCLVDRKGRPTERAHRLHDAVREVLERAIEAGGSTLRDYRHADGSSGSFQNAFAVYDRAGGRCLRAGCGGVVRRIIHAGRATYFCGRCQP